MHQTFTGSSRRQRNVNLSGQQQLGGPRVGLFSGARTNAAGSRGSNAVAQAQVDRLHREQERERVAATKRIQRVWRGSRSREEIKGIWRGEWDEFETKRRGQGVPPEGMIIADGEREAEEGKAYDSAAECFAQMMMLLRFLNIKIEMDRVRLVYFGQALQKTLEVVPSIATGDSWTLKLYRLSTRTIEAMVLTKEGDRGSTQQESLLSILLFLSKLIPKQMARNAHRYYFAIAKALPRCSNLTDKLRSHYQEAILALLSPLTAETMKAYTAFGTELLTTFSPQGQSVLTMVAEHVNYKMLAVALLQELESDRPRSKILADPQKSLWLLANIIYLHRNAGGNGKFHVSQELGLIKLLALLLGAQAGAIFRRNEIEDNPIEESTRARGEWPKNVPMAPLPPFAREQILSLVHKESIVGLMSHMELGDANDPDSEGQVLANYALTLTRLLPRRAGEVKMWLYEGSISLNPTSGTSTIVYLWHFSRTTSVFRQISKDYHNAIPLLRGFLAMDKSDAHISKGVLQEWRTLHLFLELYSFAITYMDDEEFLAGGRFKSNTSTQWGSKLRECSLPLQDVEQLVKFLKNLAFALYWNVAELQEADSEDDAIPLGVYFGSVTAPPRETSRPQNQTHDATRIQLRDLVTGLLRSVHQRDSRRKFFPKDFWLMSEHLDMKGFIAGVVEEEERKQEVQDDDEDDENDKVVDDDQIPNQPQSYYGLSTNLAGQVRQERAQQNARNRRMLQAVAPRHEILRNLPFFIQFDTRLEIFREFINRDQYRRRDGFHDADAWRMSVASGGRHNRLIDLRRHRATIQRGDIFQSAFDQFYTLGEGLKEPIQITFVDKFGETEAGIDGGGVTKEFLTSLITETFDPENPEQLFVTNDQNLLYPNPGKIAQANYLQSSKGDNDAEVTAKIAEDLSHYRFLGSIIGKCLYEGFLIDATFASHFLLRWALTGGTTQAAQESGYHPTMDDLRDLDEELYQGILKLKHYPGNVEADFGLNFTVTDTFTIRPTPDLLAVGHLPETRSFTRSLKPNGADIPVTNTNRPEYIYLLANHRLRSQSWHQTNAFLHGLRTIIQPMWLSMFNQSELQHLIGGDNIAIDVDDLRTHTEYSGVYALGDDGLEHPTIELFWSVLRDMEDQERRAVIKFVTSTPRAPLGGFGHLVPKFTIRDSVSNRRFTEDGGEVIGDDSAERLPSTSTCVNLLKLPKYASAGVLKERLLYAVNSGAGFDLS